MKKILLALLSVGIAFTAMQSAQACTLTDAPAPVAQAPVAPVVAAPVAQAPVAPVVAAPVAPAQEAPAVTTQLVAESVVNAPITQAPSVLLTQPAQVEGEKVLAIIDTAIDSSRMPNVIHEVCFTFNNTCNNNTGFDEGPGSARVNDWKIKGALHGFNMAQIAVQANPNVKIVFIRISDEKVYSTFSMIRNDGGSLARAIDWVSNNASRFNIKAVSISQSRSNFRAGTCPSDSLFESSVSKLKLQNVPTFVATGNDSKKNQIGFPACVSGVYSVAATDASNNVVRSSNINETTSLLASTCFSFIGQACAETVDYFGVKRPIVGTSTATVLAATLAITKNNLSSFDLFLATLPKSKNYPYISK